MATVRDEHATPVRDERSIGQLFSDLSRETTTLLRNEVELVRAEISEKISQIGSGIASMGAGGAVLYAGFLVLLQAAVFGLAEWAGAFGLPIAALIVAVVTMVVGAIMLMAGRSRLKSSNLTPSRTTESLRRDKDMVKEHVR